MPRVMTHEFSMFPRGECGTVANKLLQIAHSRVQRPPTVLHFFQVEDTQIKCVILPHLYHHVLAAEAVVLQMVAMHQLYGVGDALQNGLANRCREG